MSGRLRLIGTRSIPTGRVQISISIVAVFPENSSTKRGPSERSLDSKPVGPLVDGFSSSFWPVMWIESLNPSAWAMVLK